MQLKFCEAQGSSGTSIMSAELLKCNSGQKNNDTIKMTSITYSIYFPLVISRLNLPSLQIKRDFFLNCSFIQQSMFPVQTLPRKKNKLNYILSVSFIIFHPLTTKILQLKYRLYLYWHGTNQNKPYLTHFSDQSKMWF